MDSPQLERGEISLDSGDGLSVSRTKPFRPRNSYTRERKLEILHWHHQNGDNVYKTSKYFGLNSKMIIRWVRDEQKIIDSKAGSLRVEFAKSVAKREGLEATPSKKSERSVAAADGNIESLDILGLPKYSSPQVKPKIQIETAPFELSFPAPASPISHVENHTPPPKRVHRDEGTRTDEMLTKILSEVNNKKESPEAVDEEGLFGLQVAATLRRLSSRQKAMAKMKIQQVMLEIEFPADS